MVALTLNTLFGYMDKISEGLEKNVLVTDTLDGLLYKLDTTEMSQEMLDKLLVEYVQYLVFSLLGMVIERASSFPLLEKEELALDSDIALLLEQKAKYTENKNLLEANRAKTQDKMSKELALLVMQENGFGMNDKFNVMVNTTEMVSLFAQNEADPTPWMKSIIHLIADDLG